VRLTQSQLPQGPENNHVSNFLDDKDDIQSRPFSYLLVAGGEGEDGADGSNLFLKDETLPVTTGEGDRFFRFILVPVLVLPLKTKTM
jgi:hypothetical protein